MSRAWIVVASALVVSAAAGMVACYNPNPADGAFQCNGDNGFLCPDGLTCDRGAGLCVKKVPADLGGGNGLPNFDLTATNSARSCGERVQQGAFSNLVNMGAVNTAADQSNIALNGSQIFFIQGGTLMSATLGSNKKTAGAATSANLTGAPAVLNGGSFDKSGAYWFSGANSANGASSLYKATGTPLTAALQALPNSTACSFFDPVFEGGNSAAEMYLAYPMAGCNDPQGRGITVAQGKLGQNLGTFYVAFADYNYRAPFLVSGDTTMLLASVGSGARLFYSTRSAPDTDGAWTVPQLLPMGSIGTGTRDVQAAVSSDCSVLYVVSERPGGSGGLDLWAADIAAQ